MCCNLQYSDFNNDNDVDDEEEAYDDITEEIPVLNIKTTNQEQDQTLAIRQEEFPELQQEENTQVQLRDKKVREYVLRWILHVSDNHTGVWHMYSIQVAGF